MSSPEKETALKQFLSKAQQRERDKEILKTKGPAIGQKVHVDGRQGTFVVLGRNSEDETADILRVSGIRQIEGGVPFNTLGTIEEQIRPEAEDDDSEARLA